MSSSAADPYVQVLLVESDQDKVSILTLCVSEIKECRLQVAPNITRALVQLQEREPDLILFSHDPEDQDGLRILAAIHRNHPSLQMIVSLPAPDDDLMGNYMRAGATDCVINDANYVPNLMTAVKNALIRLAERDAFDLPILSRADQFAIDENLPDLVFLIDRDGKILHANRAINEMLGYQQGDVIHRPFSDLLGEEGKVSFQEYLGRVEFSQNFRGSINVRNRVGEEEPFEINCSFVEDLIYGVLRRDSSWEAIADMIDEFNPDATALEEPEDAEEELDGRDAMPARLGNYRVVTLLGAGAMGRVYKGYDEQLDRHVAIKVISRSLAADGEYLERFQREAKILASISHPNIALIYQYGNTPGSPPFFCMEFMPGGSLEDILQKQGTLDPETAISYGMQVALGLSEAFKKNVVHMDIKPSNLMIGENDRLKIVDFGLAKTGRDLESGNMGVVGTPHYIAPEQIQGKTADYRSDIYSLGVTLFRMLFGATPFTGTTLVEILHNQFHHDLPPRETLDPAVPQVLYDIIRRMMAKDPTRRYASYSDLIQDLENARRALHHPGQLAEIPRPPEATVLLQGMLYDRPFAEVLGEVIRKNLTGKLVLSWIDLRKNIYFKEGKIAAVLSNQEGESFIDLLLTQHHLSARKAREIQSDSIDLFLHYSSAIGVLNPEVRENVVAEIHLLAWRILQGLFSWMVGEFMFEREEFQGQIALQIPANDVLLRGVKEWIDPSVTRRQLMNGHCRIRRSPNFQKLLPTIKMKPADTFLLFRFEENISFQDLFNLSGIHEEEFFRLIYLFKCAGIVTVEELPREASVPRPSRKKADSQTAQAAPVQRPAPASPNSPVEARAADARVIAEMPAGAEAQGGPPAPQSDMGQYYFKLAHQSYRNKNYWAAVEYCKKSLEHRKDVSTCVLMGNALSRHPNFRFEAMNAYKQALSMDPDNPAIHRDMGDLYFKTGNMALARARYQDVLRLDPTDSHAETRLATITTKGKAK